MGEKKELRRQLAEAQAANNAREVMLSALLTLVRANGGKLALDVATLERGVYNLRYCIEDGKLIIEEF